MIKNRKKIKNRNSKLFFIIFFFSIILCTNVEAVFSPQKILEKLGKKNQSDLDEYSTSLTVVETLVLEKIKPKGDFFFGTVTPIEEVVLSFEIPGKLSKVKRTGSYIVAEIKDKDGNIVREGTNVAEFDMKHQKFLLEKAKIAKDMAEKDYLLFQKDFERTNKLVTSNVLPSKLELESQTRLTKARLYLKEVDMNYNKANENLMLSKLKSPISGIISKVYKTPGNWVAPGESIIKVTKINPIIVKIDLLASLKSVINQSNVVLVYPQGSDNPVPAWILNDPTDLNSIYLMVNNSLASFENSPGETTGFPNIYEVFPVLKLYDPDPEEEFINKTYNDSKNDKSNKKISLAIPIKSIYTDKKGSYVFRAVNEKANTLKKGVNKIFDIERVDIVPGNVFRKELLANGAAIEIQSLKDPGRLKLNDIIIASTPEKLKSGDRVSLMTKQWNFYPDQTVKVKIPTLNRQGFYVPRRCIIRQDNFDSYIYIVKNNTLKLEKISIIGYSKGYYAIASYNIKNGDEVLLVTPNLYSKIYDGAEVFVSKTHNIPEFISKTSVLEMNPQEGDLNLGVNLNVVNPIKVNK